MQTVHLEQTGTAVEPRATTKALEAVTLSLAKAKKAVLLVGAGISTNAGIPDFRSQGSGLYSSTSSPSSASTSTLKGPELFSAGVYRSPETKAEHLRFIAALKQSLDNITSSARPSSSSSSSAEPVTKTHGFMSMLKKRGQLMRVYTQNIDGLEGVGTGLQAVPLEGLTPSSAASAAPALSRLKGKGKAKVEGDFVQLHGSVGSVRCTGCEFVRVWGGDDDEAFGAGEVGACPQCEERATIRSARGQRPLSSLQRAFLRPSITLYDEAPVAALTIGSLSVSDLSSSPDCLIVMGTSLKIPGFKKLVKEFAKAVKAKGGMRVLVNREEMGGKAEWKDVFDYQVISDIDSFVIRVTDDWKKSRPRDWAGRQATLGELFSTGATKKGLAATASKPRQPLSALSSNSPSISALPTISSSAFAAENLPALPALSSIGERKRVRSSSSSEPRPSFSLEIPTSMAKRSRLSETPVKPALASAAQITPTKSRQTRSSLRAGAASSSSSPSSAAPPSPPRLRAPPPSSALSPSRSRPGFAYDLGRPLSHSEMYLAARLKSEFKPPRLSLGSGATRARGMRTPSPPPPATAGERATVVGISPDLW
ncbi:hypothetical protein JCM10213_005262 [Rhodosporidiobolus nylandii]